MWAPVSEEDQLLSILAILQPKYEPTTAVLTLRDDSYNVKPACAYFLRLKVKLFNSLFLQSLQCYPMLLSSPKRPWNTVYGSHPLMKVVIDPIDRITMEAVVGGEKDPLRISQRVNSMRKLDM